MIYDDDNDDYISPFLPVFPFVSCFAFLLSLFCFALLSVLLSLSIFCYWATLLCFCFALFFDSVLLSLFIFS